MRNRRFGIRGGWLAVLIAAAAGSVEAQALPDAVTAAHCDSRIGGQDNNLDDPTACAVPGASVQLKLTPTAESTAHAAYDGGIDSHAATHAEIVYYFEVTGGNPGTAVPVLIDARLSSDASAPGPAGQTGSYAFASLQVNVALDGGYSTQAAYVAACTDLAACAANAFAGTLAVQVSAGIPNFVTLDIVAGVGDSFSAEFADASADPRIYVDPSFADASSYSVVFSAGVGNASPVPEPGTAALMALGVGWLLLRAGAGRVGSAARD